jgi:hypothetical protein
VPLAGDPIIHSFHTPQISCVSHCVCVCVCVCVCACLVCDFVGRSEVIFQFGKAFVAGVPCSLRGWSVSSSSSWFGVLEDLCFTRNSRFFVWIVVGSVLIWWNRKNRHGITEWRIMKFPRKSTPCTWMKRHPC